MPIVRRNKANVFRCQGINLLPGNNPISEEQLKMLMQSDSFQNQLKSNVMSIVEVEKEESVKDNLSKEANTEEDKEDLKEIRDILETSVKKAVPLIEEVYSIPMLEKIKKMDARKGIHDAVDIQIEEITKDDEEGNKDKDEE